MHHEQVKKSKGWKKKLTKCTTLKIRTLIFKLIYISQIFFDHNEQYQYFDYAGLAKLNLAYSKGP